MMSMSLIDIRFLGDIAILNIKCADYRNIISGIKKVRLKNVMQNIDLTEKSVTL